MIEYDIPRARLEEACRITPGIESPTIAPLSNPDWVAVKAMVERRTSLPVILWDERLTTVAADRVMDETGVRDHKEYVDEIAAMLILQGYLDRVNAGLPVPEVKLYEE